MADSSDHPRSASKWACRGNTNNDLADELVVSIYQATGTYPKDELFGLTSQMRRSAVSVAATIVEGAARNTERDFVHFLDIALGSLREFGYYLSLSRRLGYLKADAADGLDARYDEAARVLAGLIKTLRSKS